MMETLVDAANPVVKLCAEGMMAEGRGQPDEAHDLFARAWAASSDDFEACIAAHYLARRQPNPQETLRWNRESLARANAVGDERVRGFYPSLYLNMGHSYDVLGDWDEARRYYDLAAASADDLHDDGYGAMVRRGIAAGQRRVDARGE
jgi:tetratricopeptide (TPR) repeat protein